MMSLIEVHVRVQEGSRGPYREGWIQFECGLWIRGIHFVQTPDHFYVNYPAVRDKYRKFHPSFQLCEAQEERTVKDILRAAWNISEHYDGCSVYGYRKLDCNKSLRYLSEDDFEWSTVKQETNTRISGIQQFPLNVNLYPKKDSVNIGRQAYASLLFGDSFAIYNVQVFERPNGIIAVQFPSAIDGNAYIFFSETDRIYVEERVKKAFQTMPNLQEQNKFQEVWRAESQDITPEEHLFQVLWSSSENGYIRQSQIRFILERNQIDWKNVYQVPSISKLVEKMDFLSSRRLETIPEHYVDWVSISHEKSLSSIVTMENNKPILDYKLKEQLHQALAEEYRKNGKLDLSTIIPCLRAKHPEIASELPQLKLKTILLECEFVQFEGGPMPPIFVHVLGEDVILNQRYEEDMAATPKGESDTTTGLPMNARSAVMLPEKSNNKVKPLAKRNPFTLVANTKLIAEHKLPDTKIPKVTAGDAMRAFQTQTRLGNLESIDLELVYWISNMQYAKSSFLHDLILSEIIVPPAEKKINPDKLNTRLLRLYKCGLIDFYRLCSVDEKGNIIGKANHRLLMITQHGRTHLRAIGRRSDFDYFMALDNIEAILNKLSINQWFAKSFLHFKTFSNYFINMVVEARISEANAARIRLVMDYCGIPVFVTSVRRGALHEMDIRSGDFAFWIRRVSNLLNNYQELYIENKKISFIKRPIVVFIGEDADHCAEIFQQLYEVAETINDRTILDTAWFAEDIDIYNQFLHAHYRFDCQGHRISVNISEHLEEEIDEKDQIGADFIDEQSIDDDERILKELDLEEQKTWSSIIESTNDNVDEKQK